MTAQEDLSRLYRDTVLEHSRAPHNFRRIAAADRRAEGNNPLCGDRITLYLDLAGDRIDDAAFEASGCAISVASASMLTEMVRGRRIEEARAAIRDAAALFSGESAGDGLGALAALASVRAYPARIRCAMLPWRTLESALSGNPATVSTEGTP